MARKLSRLMGWSHWNSWTFLPRLTAPISWMSNKRASKNHRLLGSQQMEELQCGLCNCVCAKGTIRTCRLVVTLHVGVCHRSRSIAHVRINVWMIANDQGIHFNWTPQSTSSLLACLMMQITHVLVVKAGCKRQNNVLFYILQIKRME